jgi:N-acetyl-gamma-glutamyl-phosphate reductase
VVFLAVPDTLAAEVGPVLARRGPRVIDLSGAFRLHSESERAHYYPHSPDPGLPVIYGLTERYRKELGTAPLIANPGCYPTAAILALQPLIAAGLIQPGVIIDAKSGVSGAGRKAEVHTLFAEAADNFKAYGVAGHRHLPEIRQGLESAAGKAVGLTFVPHLTPMIRGIHATLYARVQDKSVDLQGLYALRYAHEPFVDVLPAGSHPDTRSVRAANFCRLAVHRPQGGDTVVVLSVIDNLVKGAAGQAVQNMNLMFGLPETTGLTAAPVVP